MKKIMLILNCLLIFVFSFITFSGCSWNQNWFDDFNLSIGYIIIEENGQCVLHKVSKWADSESDSVMVSCSCCNNYIWTTANKATLYKNKPSASRYDVECKG